MLLKFRFNNAGHKNKAYPSQDQAISDITQQAKHQTIQNFHTQILQKKCFEQKLAMWMEVDHF